MRCSKKKLEEIRAVFITERFRKDDFFIGVFRDADGYGLSVLGTAEPDSFTAQMEYRLYGRRENNDKYGPQFRLETFVVAKPQSRTGVIKYLCQAGKGLGLGQVTATKLWHRFGGDAVRIMREQPEVATAAVDARGFTAARAEAVAERLREWSAIEECSIELIDLLSGRGFPKALARKCIRIWGNQAAEILQRDPFKLMRFRGCGFLTCDSFYLDLGLPANRLKRQAYAATYTVASDSNGHVWFAAETAVKGIQAHIGQEQCEPEKALTLAKRGGLLVEHVDDSGRRWVAESRDAKHEETIAECVAKSEQEESEWPDLSGEGTHLTEHQLHELGRATGGMLGLLCGAAGTGKAQPLDAKILTPTGWIKMGEVKTGDKVIAQDGSATKVTAVYPQGTKAVYRVTLSDGSSTECCDDHIWITQRDYEYSRGCPGKPRTLHQIRHDMRRPNEGRPLHRIPMVSPVKFCRKQVPIDPYLLGVLLGDGCLTSCTDISNPEKELIGYVRESLPQGVHLIRRAEKWNSNDWAIRRDAKSGENLLRTSLRSMGLLGLGSHEKFIPEEYKINSIECRKAVLQGLLDTDGYTDGHCIEFTTTSKTLCNDFKFLVESLGGRVTVNIKERPEYSHNGEKRIGRPAYRVIVMLDSSIRPFRLTRKMDRYIPKTKYPPSRRIIDVKQVGQKECQCISVADESGLYVTDDFIVTHNTTSAAPLIKACIREFGHGEVACCAPTGKAAVRLTESLAGHGVGIQATTIHRMLCVESAPDDGDGGGGWSFKHHQTNPLPFKFIVVDEFSMVAADLLRSLLVARAKGTHILFLGDPYQLSPVGRGAPQRDLIAAGLPYGELTEIHRNAGTIVQAGAAIRDRRPIPLDDRLEPDAMPPRNLKLVPANKDRAQQVVLDLVRRVGDMPGIDPVQDVQVICAVNKRSPLARVSLNEKLQDQLNPGGQRVKGSPFRVGDKVIVTKNSTLPLADGDDSVFCANGEFARVLEVHTKKTIVEFQNPPRRVLVPRGGGDQANQDGDDGANCDLSLAYACTCHRMQGSSAPIVIVCLDEYPGASGRFGVCDRGWAYTAITRAERVGFLVGSYATLKRICGKVAIEQRKTFLVESIQRWRSELKVTPSRQVGTVDEYIMDMFA